MAPRREGGGSTDVEDVAPDLCSTSTVALRMDNRVPAGLATFLAVCATTGQQRLIVVICTRTDADEPWTIMGAREAGMNERAMWRKYTS